MKILYVENHESFISVVKEEFMAEHEVIVTGSVSEAKRIFDKSFNLVLCDYDLDDGKGADFVKFLRHKESSVPVVAVSSHNEGNEALIKAGANIICSKMDFKNLPRVIKELEFEI